MTFDGRSTITALNEQVFMKDYKEISEKKKRDMLRKLHLKTELDK